ncbi:MAG: hypothetical protein ACHQRM_05850 [Bacteroidia bacterium]
MDAWTFEYNQHNNGYDQGNQCIIPFSETFLASYLSEKDRKSFYCCLQYNPTEEAVFVYGAKDALVIEARLITSERINTYILKVEEKTGKSLVTLKHFPDWEEEMQVAEDELFTATQVVEIVSGFYKNRTIDSGATLQGKAYMFPCR